MRSWNSVGFPKNVFVSRLNTSNSRMDCTTRKGLLKNYNVSSMESF